MCTGVAGLGRARLIQSRMFEDEQSEAVGHSLVWMEWKAASNGFIYLLGPGAVSTPVLLSAS